MMRAHWMRWASLLALLLPGMFSAADPRQTTAADPWQIDTACAVVSASPAPLDGVILTHDPDAGVRALRAGVATTYFIAFEGSNFTGAGALSPDGRWFAMPHGTITTAAAFDVRYRVTEIRVHSTDAVPQIRRRIPWDATFQAGEVPSIRWLDADTLLYPEGGLDDPLTGISVDPLADPLEKTASPLAAYAALAPDLATGIGRYQDTDALYDTASGWVRARLTDLSGYVWSPDSARFAAVQRRESGAALVVIDAASLETRVLLDVPPDHVVRNLRWSPDGTRLAFSLFDPQENANRLYIGALDGGTLTDPCIGLHPGVAAVAWSPDGARLALVTADDRLELYEPGTGERYSLAGFSGGLMGWGAG